MHWTGYPVLRNDDLNGSMTGPGGVPGCMSMRHEEEQRPGDAREISATLFFQALEGRLVRGVKTFKGLPTFLLRPIREDLRSLCLAAA